MIEITIPGGETFRLLHLVSDVNGTLAVDGTLIDGVEQRIGALRDRIGVHLLTADTHGHQDSIDVQLGMKAVRLVPGNEQDQKRSFVQDLGASTVVAFGQGANDALMLKAAALGICVISREGTSIETLMACDILVPDIWSAFDLLDNPLRVRASLRK